METNRRTTAILSAIIAVLAIVAGALWYAQSGLKAEVAQLLDARRALGTERDALKAEVQAQRDRIGVLDTELKALQEAQQLQKSLTAEKDELAQQLARVQEQAKAAVATGANLSRELSVAKQTLDQARARSVELNKSYEKLLKEHSKLAGTDAARQTELALARSAFEEAQTEVARLTGARGIYTVQTADSRSSIAAYFYRNGNRWPDIHKENTFLAKNPDLIYAGQVLIIPK